jgi:hypothetical protein
LGPNNMAKKKKKIWIISLQTGEYPEWDILDEKAVLFEVDKKKFDKKDSAGIYAPPTNCTDTAHIHVKDLLKNSVWKDEILVNEAVIALQQAMRKTEAELDIPHLNSREAVEIIARLPKGWHLIKDVQ